MSKFEPIIREFYQDQSGQRHINADAGFNIIRLFHRTSVDYDPELFVYNFGTIIQRSNQSYTNALKNRYDVQNIIHCISNLPHILTVNNLEYFLSQTSYHFDISSNKEYSFGIYNTIGAFQNNSSNSKFLIYCEIFDWNTHQKTTHTVYSSGYGRKGLGISQTIINNQLTFYYYEFGSGFRRIAKIDLTTLTSQVLGVVSGVIYRDDAYSVYDNVIYSSTDSASICFIEGARIFVIRREGSNVCLKAETLQYNNGQITNMLLGHSTYNSIDWIFIDHNFNLFFSYNGLTTYYAYYAGDYSSSSAQLVGNITSDERKYKAHGGSDVYIDSGSYLNRGTESTPIMFSDRLKMAIEWYNGYTYQVCYRTFYKRPSLIWSESNPHIDHFAVPQDTGPDRLRIQYQTQSIDETFIYASVSNTNSPEELTKDTRFLINEEYINNIPIKNWRMSNYVLNSLRNTYNYRKLIPVAFVKREIQYGYDKVFLIGVGPEEIVLLSSDDGFTNSYNQLFYLTNEQNISESNIEFYYFIRARNNSNCWYIVVGFTDRVYYFCVKGARYNTFIKTIITLTGNNRSYGSQYIESLDNEDRIHIMTGYYINNGTGNAIYVAAQKNTSEIIKSTAVRVSSRLYGTRQTKDDNNYYHPFLNVYGATEWQHYTDQAKNELGTSIYHVISDLRPPLFEQQLTRKYIMQNPPRSTNYGFRIIGVENTPTVGVLFVGLCYFKDKATVSTKII